MSALHHCYDGWSNLAQAVCAETMGNRGVAQHLGYYAQLRAAMSILAAHGIGIVDRRSVVIDKTGSWFCMAGSRSTHKMAWLALETWTKHTSHAWFMSIIQPNGIPLAEWTQPIISQWSGILAEQWLTKWSQMFYNMPDDRNARNRASYEPVGLLDIAPQAARDVVTSVIAMWRLVEPSGTAGFERLDYYLLKQAVRMRADVERNQVVQTIPNALSLSGNRMRYWNSLLMRPIDDCDSFLEEAYNDSTRIASRAFLLLRVATGIVASLLSKSTDDPRGSLDFWWQDVRIRRHLWKADEPPEVFSDLWCDIDVAMARIEHWSSVDREGCYYDLWRDCGGDIAVLSTTERIFLWGLGL